MVRLLAQSPKQQQQQHDEDSSNHGGATSYIKLIFVFLLGFLASKGSDMIFQIKDLRDMLQQEAISLSNEKKKSVAAATATAPTKKSSAFDAIVQTAYDRALQTPPPSPTSDFGSFGKPRRPAFDVDWWETSSNSTTAGGLFREDRAALGKIYGAANSVFEYGLGESTYIANYVGVPRYAGIDSDPVWVGMARDKVSPHYRFYLGDIGPTREWGYPNQVNNTKSVLNYQLLPLIAEPLPFDVYMVDGRWRLPALLACFLHASDRGANPTDTIAMIHDCGRPIYHTADHLLEKQTTLSTTHLCVYKRKPTTTDEQLQQLWDQHKDVLSRRR